MNIGKTIKKLRRERNMTQERLATFLNISPQAVSRWENGLAMPELSLVPVIANLFGVTTDLLFGLDGDNIDKAIEAIIKRADDAESERDHNAACISILEEGICKYPSNW
ncbi:MAG: helix-turn-helix domain-containing protein, partial [Clostridia bacterium]|nr:helix-turn-helix domain-containing protein [Clostridia bacterium]